MIFDTGHPWLNDLCVRLKTVRLRAALPASEDFRGEDALIESYEGSKVQPINHIPKAASVGLDL